MSDLPTVLGLYEDIYDDAAVPTGFKLVAWGLVLPNGQTITVSPSHPRSVTLWRNLEDATDSLDAFVATVEPRHVKAWLRHEQDEVRAV